MAGRGITFVGEGDHVFIGVAGEDLAKGELLYFADDGIWKKANASSLTKMPARALAIDNIKKELKGRILLFGFMSMQGWSWLPGHTLYAGLTDGQMTQTKPDPDLYKVQVLGVGMHDSRYVYFHPEDVSEIGIGMISNPPQGSQFLEVINLFVEIVNGKPKLTVEYNE